MYTLDVKPDYTVSPLPKLNHRKNEAIVQPPVDPGESSFIAFPFVSDCGSDLATNMSISSKLKTETGGSSGVLNPSRNG